MTKLASWDEILIVFPARLTRPFFASLYAECEHAILTKLNMEYRPILRSIHRTKSQFDPNAIKTSIMSEVDKSPNIKLIIVVPTAEWSLSEVVAQVQKRLKIPVVALTLPLRRAPFNREGISVPPCVLCNSAQGTFELGHEAGKTYRNQHKSKLPQVLLVPGEHDRLDSKTRLSFFSFGLAASLFGISTPNPSVSIDDLPPLLRQLCSYNPVDKQAKTARAVLDAHRKLSATTEESPPGGWIREKAKERVTELLANRSAPVDIIFAASDQMALGSLDAISDVANRSRQWKALVSPKCKIYGFDGIAEIKNLIDSRHPFIAGTVVQPTQKLANQAFKLVQEILTLQNDVIAKLQAGENPTEIEPRLVEPHLYTGRKADKKQDIQSRYPNFIPDLDIRSDEWIADNKVYEIEKPPRAQAQKFVNTLGTDRTPSHGGEKVDEYLGMDQHGRIWRKSPASKRIFYHVDSLRAD